jgi:hypothetical protein
VWLDDACWCFVCKLNFVKVVGGFLPFLICNASESDSLFFVCVEFFLAVAGAADRKATCTDE